MRILVSFLILLLFGAPNAHAVRVRNIDDQAHRLHVRYIGETETRELKPNGIFTTRSPGVFIGLDGQAPFRTRVDEEYMIKGGVLYLQRHDYRGGGRR